MYLKPTTPEMIATQVAAVTRPTDSLAIIMVAEHSEIDIPALMEALNQQKIPFIGGIFPGVIVGNTRYESGIAVTFIPRFIKPVVIKNLHAASFSEEDFQSISDALSESKAQPTALVFVDGLTTNIELLLARMYRKLFNSVSYIGGGAGSLTLQQMPCVFDNDGFYQDAAIIALLGTTSQIGVRHGWNDLQGPYTATETKRNIVMKLDGKSAFEKYSEIIKRITGETLNKKNFFDIAKGFPLGLYYKGADRIVRDPITYTDDGGLVCVGEVPQNSVIHILQGAPKPLIMAANRATKEALGKHEKIDHVFVVDCISRVLFLKEQFGEELNSVRSALPVDSSPPIGVLSLGEIGSYGSGSPEFFNKTFVICTMQSFASKTEVESVSLIEQPVGA